MFVCTELIEETGRLSGLIFGMCEYFWPCSDMFEFGNFFAHLMEWRHFSKCDKSYKCLYLTSPKR